MRLALEIAQNQSRSTDSTALLNVTGSIPRIMHTVMRDCSDPVAKGKLQHNQKLLLDPGANFELRCYDHASMPSYVRKWLPQYADMFENLPPFRADLFRYMALWHEGGFYADDDVVIQPGFLHGLEEQRAKPFIVGWERYTPSVDIGHQGCRDSQENVLCDIGEPYCMLCNSLAQWSFGAMPKHSLTMDLIHQAVKYLEHPLVKDLSDHEAQDIDVLMGSGPIMFSTRVLMDQQPSEVLGMNVFGCGQPGYANSPACDPGDDSQWSQHLFEGKWRAATN